MSLFLALRHHALSLEKRLLNRATLGQLLRDALIGLLATLVTAYLVTPLSIVWQVWLVTASVGLCEFVVRKTWVFRA